MATQDIASGASCYACIPDKLAALIFLLATNAGVTDPQTIANGARCYACIPDKWAAMLYLLDNGGSGGSSGSGDIIALTGSNVPAGAPASGKGIAYNEIGQQWVWDATGSAWIQVIA